MLSLCFSQKLLFAKMTSGCTIKVSLSLLSHLHTRIISYHLYWVGTSFSLHSRGLEVKLFGNFCCCEYSLLFSTPCMLYCRNNRSESRQSDLFTLSSVLTVASVQWVYSFGLSPNEMKINISTVTQKTGKGKYFKRKIFIRLHK